MLAPHHRLCEKTGVLFPTMSQFSVLGVELESKPADIALRIGCPAFSSDGFVIMNSHFEKFRYCKVDISIVIVLIAPSSAIAQESYSVLSLMRDELIDQIRARFHWTNSLNEVSLASNRANW